MSNHIWGLIHHPDKEWRSINEEHETVSHLYTHHVLWYALIPVVCSYIGTTRVGWTFGGEEVFQVSPASGLILGAAFYALILLAVAAVGSIIHWMARRYPERPSKAECIVFAGYTATPLFLSGVFAIYPVFWLCVAAVCAGVVYTAYLLYAGTPSFLGINDKEGFILSTSTLCMGVLILEALLIIAVALWSMGSEHSIMWYFFR